MKKTLKLLSALLALIMLVSVFAACGGNDAEETTGAPVDSTPETETPPPAEEELETVKIINEEQFKTLISALNENPESSKGKYYKLFVDINLNSGWIVNPTTTLGKLTPPDATTEFAGIKEFYGVFDGNGKTITGIYKVNTATDGAAVGGFITKLNGGTVKNLTVSTSYIVDNGGAGAPIGGLVGTVNGDGAVIDNVTVNAHLYSASDAAATVGGVVGCVEAENLTISNTTFEGKVGNIASDMTVPSASTAAVLGQIIGNAGDKAVTLNACKANGSIICNEGATKNDFVGTGSKVTDNGSTVTAPADAGLIEVSEYKIYTAAELLAIAAYESDYAGKTITLMRDIDLNPDWNATVTVGSDSTVTLPTVPANKWTPIPLFKGTFNGNGNVISGLYSSTDYEVPATNADYYGGFINVLEGGTVKNLIVKNSLAYFTSTTGTAGTSRIRIGGFIGRVIDANLDTLFVDMDAWNDFDWHYTMGGMICEIDTAAADDKYVGTIQNLVYAGAVGRIDANGKVSEGSGTSYTAGMIAQNHNAVANDDKVSAGTATYCYVTMKNLSFIGTWYKAAGSGDPLLGYTGSGNYNAGIGVNNMTMYAMSKGSVKIETGAIGDVAKDIGNNRGATVTADDKYTETEWKLYAIANDAGENSSILLPAAVVDMLMTKNTIAADTSWYNDTDKEFTISNAAQLLGLSQLAQTVYEADGETVKTAGKTFEGVTIKLGADIDLNPGWNATTTINSANVVTVADAPLNEWIPIPLFKGTFDGQGHTINGIYAYVDDVFNPDGDENITYWGGFIDELTNGTIRNLIVKNSLAYFTVGEDVTTGHATMCIGGFIGRVTDSVLDTMYVDIDSWFKFSQHYTMGGMICAVHTEAADDKYVGSISDIVFAGSTGRICSDGTWNAAEGTSRIYTAGMIAQNHLTKNAENYCYITMTNLSNIGMWYRPNNSINQTTGDPVVGYTGGTGYSSGIAVNNTSCYIDEAAANAAEGAYKHNIDLSSTATDYKNNSGTVTEGDTYSTNNDWATMDIETGCGKNTGIVLPKKVVDMLKAANA